MSAPPISATDPLATVWNALEAHDCEPHGQTHDFRAKCPAHSGDNRDALHVSVGGDGSARVWCFAHACRVEDVTRALGLAVADLFPAGHKRATKRDLPAARRVDFTGSARTAVNVLSALQDLDRGWYLELRFDCPHCGSPGALLQATPKAVTVSFPGDDYAAELGYTACTLEQFTRALAGHIEDRRAA